MYMYVDEHLPAQHAKFVAMERLAVHFVLFVVVMTLLLAGTTIYTQQYATIVLPTIEANDGQFGGANPLAPVLHTAYIVTLSFNLHVHVHAHI